VAWHVVHVREDGRHRGTEALYTGLIGCWGCGGVDRGLDKQRWSAGAGETMWHFNVGREVEDESAVPLWYHGEA
jgi:hypothetical protein